MRAYPPRPRREATGYPNPQDRSTPQRECHEYHQRELRDYRDLQRQLTLKVVPHNPRLDCTDPDDSREYPEYGVDRYFFEGHGLHRRRDVTNLQPLTVNP